MAQESPRLKCLTGLSSHLKLPTITIAALVAVSTWKSLTMGVVPVVVAASFAMNGLLINLLYLWKTVLIIRLLRHRGGIGIRNGLKIRRPFGIEGSSPSGATIYFNPLSIGDYNGFYDLDCLLRYSYVCCPRSFSFDATCLKKFFTIFQPFLSLKCKTSHYLLLGEYNGCWFQDIS